MKIFKYLTLALTVVMAMSANSQELKKTVLGIEDFTYSSDFSPAEVEQIRNNIISAIRNTNRVIVLDHSKSTNRALANESERRKQESAMDANTVADMGTLNANSLMTIHLDNINTTKEIYEEYEYKKVGDKNQKVVKGRYPYYKGSIAYTVKITDCETGAVQNQQNFSHTVGNYSTFAHKADYDSWNDARAGIVNKCVNQDEFTILILNTFKAAGKILQMEEGNEKKAKTVYVSLGSEDGVTKKQVLEVYKEVDIAGEKSQKLIGEVEIYEIMGPNRSLAKVKKGGDAIAQCLSSGTNMPVKTRDVKMKVFGGVN